MSDSDAKEKSKIVGDATNEPNASSHASTTILPRWLVVLSPAVSLIVLLSSAPVPWVKAVMEVLNSRKEQAQAEAHRAADDKDRAKVEKETENARKESNEVELQIERMKLQQRQEELAQSEKDAQRNEATRENQRIADLVSAVIDGNQSQLAGLLLYANRDSTHRDLVLAGLEAKSEFLKSPSEVRLLFLLLNRIGSDALPVVIEENRKFLAGYDDVVWRQFSADLQYSKFLKTNGKETTEPSEEIDEQLNKFVMDFASRLPSEGLRHHAGAVVVNNLNGIVDPDFEGGTSLDSKEGIRRALERTSKPVENSSLFAIQTEFLFQSVEFLNHALPIYLKSRANLDLRRCALVGIRWENIDALHSTIDVTDALLDGADFEPENRSHEIVWSQASMDTLKSSTIDVLCSPPFEDSNKFSDLKVGLETSPFLSGARFGPLSSWEGPEEFRSDLTGCSF